MIAFLLHLWRLLTAVTIYRKVQPELDEREPLALPLPAAPDVTVIVTPVQPFDDEEHDEPHPAPAWPPPQVPVIDPASTLSPLVVDDEGWLHGDKVVHVPTKRPGYKLRGKGAKVTNRPSGLLVHWTSTTHGTALGMARRTAPDNGEGNWVHLWVEHDGTIYQSGSFHRGAPHAGAPSSKDLVVDDHGLRIESTPKESKYSANSFLIGSETVCVGELRWRKKVGGDWVQAKPHEAGAVLMSWPFGKKNEHGKAEGHIIDESEAVEARDREGVMRIYQRFTEQQVEAYERLMRALWVKYGFTDAAMSWGHCDVDPTRKSDPGGHFSNIQRPGILARIRSS